MLCLIALMLDALFLYSCLVYRPCDFAQLYDATDGALYTIADRDSQRAHIVGSAGTGGAAADFCAWFVSRRTVSPRVAVTL